MTHHVLPLPIPHRARIRHRSRATHSLLRMLDGRHRWGTIATTTSRYGGTSEWLMILPPDTSIARRRWVTAAQAMPPLVLLGTIVAGCVASGADVAAHLAFGIPAMTLFALWLVCWHEASPATRHAARLTARTSALVASPDADARAQRIRRIVQRLRRAERDVATGLLPASALDAEWRDAYALVRRLERLGA